MKHTLIIAIAVFCSTASMNALSGLGDFLNKAKEVSTRVTDAVESVEATASTPSKKESLTTSVSDHSAEVILPFGEITWDDQIFTIIRKIQHMDADKIVASIGHEKVAIDRTASEQQVSGKLDHLIRQKIQSLDALKAKGLLGKYINKNGNEQSYAAYGIELDAKGINILGITYHLTATLLPSPGIAIQRPKSVYMNTGLGLAMPLGLYEVSLTSRSPSLKEKHSVINKKLLTKYNRPIAVQGGRTHDSLQLWNDILSGTSGDSQGHTISIESGASHSYITYRYERFESDFSDIYGAHMSKIEAAQNSRKSDMANNF